jgi:uncharacterized protein YkwD
MRTPRRASLPVSLLLVVLICTLSAPPAQAGTRVQRAGTKLLGFVNDVRAERGIAPLKGVDGLSSLAQRHSLHMARQHRLFHTKDLRTRLRSWKPTMWGENVGIGPSLWRIARMWESSPEHLANMVNPRFHHAGVGVVFARGAFWATLIVTS